MSAQFGKCNFDGKPVDFEELDRVRPMLSPYGPDAEGIFRNDTVGIVFRAFHTNKESRLENQPYASPSGAIITWDGRLDNRSELIHKLEGGLASASTDVSIVTAAYERWGTGSLAKLIGDWALSIWDPRIRSLILAKDFVGTRHLYYSVAQDQVTWCTILDPLVLFPGRPLALEKEYIAGWLSFFPAAHLTPYVGIHSVRPSSFICLRKGTQQASRYWDFDPARRICYRKDAEYEEHFRAVFSESVRRRLRSDTPVLAELSGGMDSSSIVCVADDITARGLAETPRLDTLSYYDDSEPNWNERPYFTKIEEQRGRIGCHIDVSPQDPFTFESNESRFAATPGSERRQNAIAKRFAEYVVSQGNRVVLSGIGGDEVTGGVPTPIPELADLLVKGRLIALAHQLRMWALNKRKPLFHLLFEVVSGFFPRGLVGVPRYKRPAPWLDKDFASCFHMALMGYEGRLKLLGPLPSFQENVSTLEGLRRQLECAGYPSLPPRETRYPYLDRDLLAFIFAIPREQLVRPGQRRSLMRRALVGIVPDQVRNRRRKAFGGRASMMALSKSHSLTGIIQPNMVTSSIGIVDTVKLLEILCRTRRGQEVPIIPLTRTLTLELWLRNLRRRRLVDGCLAIGDQGSQLVRTEKTQPQPLWPTKIS